MPAFDFTRILFPMCHKSPILRCFFSPRKTFPWLTNITGVSAHQENVAQHMVLPTAAPFPLNMFIRVFTVNMASWQSYNLPHPPHPLIHEY